MAFVVAPMDLHRTVLHLIDRETENARHGRPARILAQMNALVEEDVIDALYCASQAGVPITLMVRGICCLRPGLPGVSETIEVRATIDRFLEHLRVFRFANAGNTEVYISSADWMPRNFHRRVEIMVPVADPSLRARLSDILEISAADNVKSWTLRADGRYERTPQKPGMPLVRSQVHFMEAARAKGRVVESAVRPAGRLLLRPRDGRRSPCVRQNA